MQIILKVDVQNVGFKDDLLEVKNGYGRNFLIPQGKAVFSYYFSQKSSKRKFKTKGFQRRKNC